MTLVHDETPPKARLLPPLATLVPWRRSSATSVALASRTVALTVAASMIVPLMTGLNSRPFCEIVLPRSTKLSFTSKSTSRVVVAPPTITRGLDKLTLSPDLAGAGELDARVACPGQHRAVLKRDARLALVDDHAEAAVGAGGKADLSERGGGSVLKGEQVVRLVGRGENGPPADG